MAADTGVDIDLYAEVDEIDHEVGGQHDSGGVDLYDDVLTTSAEQQAEDEALQGIVSYSGDLVTPPELPQVSGGYEYKSYTTVHPKSAASQAAQSHYERQRGKPLYVGNMTWWTTDQELTEALQECGVTDLVNIKFFENRNNGQSKGFALIELGSDKSVQLVQEHLPKIELHEQKLVVTAATKQHLHEFEYQARSKAGGASTNFQGHGGQYGQDGQSGPGYHSGDRGRGYFGYNRGGMRGRGGIRPGMGRGFEGEMAPRGPWMGPPGQMGGPRMPPPGMSPPFGDQQPPPFGMNPNMGHFPNPGMGMDKPPGAPVPPQMAMPPGVPGAGMAADPYFARMGVMGQMQRPPVAPHVNPAFFPEGPPVIKIDQFSIKARAGLKGMVVLLPLLGLTWVFGLMAVNEKTIVFQYIFAILNSLQGLFIFAFHCIGNSEVRVAYKRLHEKRTLAKSLPEHSLSSGNHHKNVEEFNKRRMNSRETNSTGDEDVIVTKAIRSVSDVKLTGGGTDHVAMQTFGDADSGRWSLNCPSPDPPCVVLQSATKDPRGDPRSAPEILDGPKATTPRESYRGDRNYPSDRYRYRGGQYANQGNRLEDSSSTNKYQRF